MTKSALIILCAIFVTIHSAAQLSCGPGEVVDTCPSNCITDKCPTKEQQYRDCSRKECGTPRCKCGFNTKRAHNGTCINTRECPPFKCDRPNEEFVACPPLCPTDDCKQSSLGGKCPMFGNILIVLECAPACRCIKGYWRKDGKCVPYDQCPSHASSLPVVFFSK